MVGRRENGFLKAILLCSVYLACICGSRGLDLALAPNSLAEPPKRGEISSSPTIVTQPHVVHRAPSPLTLPTGSAVQPPVTATPPQAVRSNAAPPAGRASISVQPPAPADDVAPRSQLPAGAVPPPARTGLISPPTGSAVHPSPSDNILSPPPRIDFQASPPVTASNPPPAQRNIPANPPTASLSIGKSTPSSTLAPVIGHAMSPLSTKQGTKTHLAPPPRETITEIPPMPGPPIQGSPPMIGPVPRNPGIPSNSTNSPMASPQAKPPSAGKLHKSPSSSPKLQNHKQKSKKGAASPALAPSYPPSSFPVEGHAVSPAPKEFIRPKRQRKHPSPPPYNLGPSLAPSESQSSPVPKPVPSRTRNGQSPAISPVQSLPAEPKSPSAHPIWTLPPPPPNLDCNYLSCPEPLTDPPTGSPCSCVLPIKVGLRVHVALFSFFPLVSDFAQEIARGVNMNMKQVRVMGANVASPQTDRTVVLINLVPVGGKFDNFTAYLTYENFWSKKVGLKGSLFGDYEVLYVTYPGLPPSPPTAPENINIDGPFGSSNSSRTMKPLGVDVGTHSRKSNRSVIAIAVLASLIVLIIVMLIASIFVLRQRECYAGTHQRLFSRIPLLQFASSSGTGHVLLVAGRHSSASGSLGSSIATYSGQAKTFKLIEIERATNRFDQSRILGEGGFGCVYQGTLEDGTHVAVKVLRRYDYQGEREFLAELEMLSRLHHRNLVKLIGICIEENARCLVYELVPNGSVESHLHGPDKDTAPLDWNARMKIALGAARGLAYLHEDSSPCVIHRDFKSSNILLEHDFTPKVSDFGLARAALGEGNCHISTRVMGTFGYVAPEYAMTGHLLVKSDVYSYGVVLLELITGRKPVDMSRLPGQENLVTWARPLLINLNGLRGIADPSLGSAVPIDSVAKAAAIASMCVQPEVSHRPSMGEVVQALKLVCTECSDEYNRECRSYDCGGSCSEELLAHASRRAAAIAGGGAGSAGIKAERVLLYDMLGSPPVYGESWDYGLGSGSFRRYSSSGPMILGERKRRFWERLRSNAGSMSDHGGTSFGFETRSEESDI